MRERCCEVLRRVLFLKALPEATLAQIAAAGYRKQLVKGEVLFEEHAPCLGLVVVLTGALKVAKLDSRGREMILQIARSGVSVGDLALFDGGNYPAGAEAVANQTVVLIVPRARFHALMAAHPAIAAGALRALAVEQRKLIEMLKAQTLHTVRARLAAYLLHAAGDQAEFALPETNATIGGHVGTVREVVSRTLHGFEDAGAIRLHGRRIVTICDRAALHDIAASRSAP